MEFQYPIFCRNFCLHVYNPLQNQQVIHLIFSIDKLDNQYKHNFW